MTKFIILVMILAIGIVIHQLYSNANAEKECNKTQEIYHNQKFIGIKKGIYIKGECLEIINL